MMSTQQGIQLYIYLFIGWYDCEALIFVGYPHEYKCEHPSWTNGVHEYTNYMHD